MYKEGEKVVCIGDFSDVRKIWRFKYPVKNDVLTIKSCVKHQQYTFWLLKFMEYTTEEQPTTGYCDLNFRKIEEVEEIEFMKLETCIKDLWWISRSALSGMETVPIQLKHIIHN